MAEPKNIFIASSGESKPLAQALARELGSCLNPSPDPELWQFKITEWYRSFEPSEGTLDSLISDAKECDFVVVLLTQDDVAQKKQETLSLPRDNTIFELGLFMGALDRDPRRCFMVSSLGKGALPSDLAGRTYIEIAQPKNLASNPDCRPYVIAAANEIIGRVKVAPRCPRPDLRTIDRNELANRERSDSAMGDLKIDSDVIAVVVNSLNPVEERDSDFCVTVLTNMKAGARYEYYFGEFDDNIVRTANLVQTLALGDLKPPNVPPEQLPKVMKGKWSQVWENLECMQRRLGLHFRKRPPLQFCVHNAESEDHAKCYLRCLKTSNDGRFVEWAEKRAAKEIAAELTGSCNAEFPDACIFHSTGDIPLSEDEISRNSKINQLIKEDNPDEIKRIRKRRETILTLIRRRFPQDLPEDQQKLLDRIWLSA